MRLFLLLIATLLSGVVSAQEPFKNDVQRCGTAPVIDPWLRAYAERPQDFVQQRSDDTLYVGLKVHLLAKDNGSGRFSPERLLTAFCQLNADYAASGIRFYFKGDWDLINNTGWYQHSTIPQGIDMMLTNNVPDALNIYFSSTAAGNCGYNLPYAGISIMHSCATTGTHTWAHEIGHALSLPHPFIGWEGKNYSAANPTPLKVTYDYTYFHDTLDTQFPVPLDTALVEFLDGSNCTIASDLICDTKPDYLSYPWNCDAQNYSTVKQYDPAGAGVYSDGSLFMSYSADNCQNRFSDEEVAAMRANLLSEKTDWLADGPEEQDITQLPALLIPAEGENTPTTGVVLSWSAVPNATHYLLQYTRISSFAVKEFEVVTTDTTFTTGNLAPNKNYYWRVRPFNHWYACTSYSPQQSFFTTPATSVSNPDKDAWRCYPSLLTPGRPLSIEIGEDWIGQNSLFSVYDVAGKLMWHTTVTPSQTRFGLSLPSATWPAGVYRLILTGEKGLKTQSILLTAG